MFLRRLYYSKTKNNGSGPVDCGLSISETQLFNFSNPEALNVSSAVSSVISKSGRNVLIWNIYKGNRELINASPGLFYLRSEGDPHDLLRRKKYKVLASMGYHVIVPVRQLDDQEISVSWTWLKENKKKSSLYLWGDQVEARYVLYTFYIQKLAKYELHELISRQQYSIYIPEVF